MIRHTPEPDPRSPELLGFTPQEAGLCIKALSYSLFSMRPVDRTALRAFNTVQEDAVDVHSDMIRHMRYVDLATRYSDHAVRPDVPLTLSLTEMLTTGDSLYRLARALIRAHAHLHDDEVVFYRPQDKPVAQQTTLDAFKDVQTLYAELEPIAQSKTGIDLVPWDLQIP